MKLEKIIKTYREENKLSLREFASRCNLSFAYIGMLEKNVNTKNKKQISPSLETIREVAKAMCMSVDNLLKMLDDDQKMTINLIKKPTKVKVYSSIHAGIPSEMIDNVIGTEEISEDMIKGGKEYFGLKVKGNSMEPKYFEKDIIIVEKCSDVESGTDCVVAINGDEAFLKKLIKTENSIILQAYNSSYEPIVIKEKEISILGKVVEIRRKV